MQPTHYFGFPISQPIVFSSYEVIETLSFIQSHTDETYIRQVRFQEYIFRPYRIILNGKYD